MQLGYHTTVQFGNENQNSCYFVVCYCEPKLGVIMATYGTISELIVEK